MKSVLCEKAASPAAASSEQTMELGHPRFPVSLEALNHSCGSRLKYPYRWSKKKKKREFNSDAGGTLEVI